MITLITCTGERQEAFSQCEKYLERQTYKGPVQWIVVDDGKIPTTVRLSCEYYRGPKIWEEGFNTQRLNMDLALTKVNPATRAIFIIEDDDWYSPSFIETSLNLLKYADIVGIADTAYYHIKIPGIKYMKNFSHASLCQTAISYKLLPLLIKAVNSGEKYFDIELWKYTNQAKLKSILIQDPKLSIGMKGLKGRGGIGVGHRDRGYEYDVNFKKLEELIGVDDGLFYKLQAGK